MIDLSPREYLSDSLPRCPVTPAMRREMEELSQATGKPLADLQRQAISLFLQQVREISREKCNDSRDEAAS